MYYIEKDDSLNIDIEFIKSTMDKLLSYYNEERDFSLSFVSDEEIKALNKEYRDIDSPTDILTFRLADGDDFPSFEEEEEMGDIFISLDSMKNNAKEFNVDEKEELSRLLLHGLLHLRGLDHKTNDFSKEEMLLEQEKVLKELGFTK